MAEIPSYLAPNVATETQAAPQTPVASTDLSNGGPSENVYDYQNKSPLDIPHSDFEIAVRSGQYAPQAKKEYVVKDSNGQMHSVLGTNLKTVFDEGSTFASPEESHAHTTNIKYGNSPVLAGIEGIERGILPGIADRIHDGSRRLDGGITTKEDLAGRAEANPLSSMVGEGIGSVLGLASPVGKATVGASTIGVTKSLAKLGAKAGLSNKVAQAIVSKIIPAAAGSAVEGAFFGAAHLLNEDALGTAQFNAENLLASVEQGALWGAAFGGGLSALGSATSSTAKAMAESGAGKYIGEKVSGISKSVNNKQNAVYEFLGITPAKANKLAKKDPEFIEDALKWTKEVLEENKSANVADVAAKATADKSSVGTQIGKVYDDVDNVMASKGMPPHTSAKDLKLKMASKLDDEILPKLDGVLGTAADAKMVNKEISSLFDDAMKSDGAMGVKELHSMMRKVDDVLFKDKQASLGALTLKQQLLKVQREVLREELNTAVATAAKSFPGELSGASQNLTNLNRRFRTITSLEDAVTGRAFAESNTSFLKGAVDIKDMFAISIDPTLGAASILGKKFLESDMLRKMQILGKIEKYQQATTSAISSSFKAVAKGIRSTEPMVSQSLISSNLSTKLENGKKIKARDEQEAYRNIAANAKFASENPEQFLQGINRYTGHLYGVAPKTSGALDTVALNAMVFLHSKATTNMKKTGFFDADKLNKASGQDMLKMQQRMDMIQSPAKAIKLLQKGKLGATHVETLKAVYPEMHAKMQEQAMNFLSSDAAKALTYSSKLNMAVLLGVQADESTAFDSVLGLQANFETSSDSDAGAVSTTQGGLSKVNKASRLNTDESDDS